MPKTQAVKWFVVMTSAQCGFWLPGYKNKQQWPIFDSTNPTAASHLACHDTPNSQHLRHNGAEPLQVETLSLWEEQLEQQRLQGQCRQDSRRPGAGTNAGRNAV